MSGPRSSVLQLFDPLSSPSTPQRESPADSDKENDNPGPVTAFFNRVYTHKKYQIPATRAGQLIDWGDDSDGEPSNALDDNVEDNNDSMDESLSFYTNQGSTPRTAAHRPPLVDIDLDMTPVMRRAANVQTKPVSIPRRSEDASATVAPRGSPLANVINAINLSAMTISTPPTSPPLTCVNRGPSPANSSTERSCPEITISSPGTGTPNMSPRSTDDPPSHDVIPAPAFLQASIVPTRRERVISSSDPRRASVDLHTSFNMQLSSAEMSFDLLNDKISFSGQDALWADDDSDDESSLDLEAEEQTMEDIAKKCENQENELLKSEVLPTSHEVLEDVIDPPRTPVFSPPKALKRQSEILDIEPASSKHASPKESVPLTPGIAPPQTCPSATETQVEPSAEPLVQTAVPPENVAPVPALRIVKKMFKVHDRPTSFARRKPSISSATSPSTRDPPAALQTFEDVACEARPRAGIKGVQRPPPGMAAKVMMPGSTIQKLAGPTRPPVRPAATGFSSGAGTSTSTTNRFVGVQRPPTCPQPGARLALKEHRSASGPSSTSTVRMPTAKSSSATRVEGVPTSSIPNIGGTVRSTLPRPVSRLPAPSTSFGFRSVSTNVRSKPAGH